MKNTLLYSIALVTLCAGALAAAKIPGQPTEIRFEADSGDWAKSSNWQGGKLPGIDNGAAVRKNAVITVSSAVPECYGFTIGAPGKGATIYLEKGALVKTGANFAVGVNTNKTLGVCVMRGGELESGVSANFFSATSIGCSATNSSRGEMTISGGILRGGVVVGSALPNTGTGKLCIVGSAAKIEGKPSDKGHFQISSFGEVSFVFDEKGVTRVETARTVVFQPGATLTVDAAKFTSAARGKTVALITAPRIEDGGLQSRVIAAPRGLRGEITVETKGKNTGVFVRFLPE